MKVRTCLVALALVIVLPRAVRADFVRNFDVQIRVQTDASLDVTETIDVVFEQPRHGIYRFIPIRYDRYGQTFSAEFRLQSITDGNDRNLPYTKAQQGRDINMRIGDKDVQIIGPHTYRIHYVVRRAVNFFNDAPEVYWNVTGIQWPYRIEQATATIVPPAGTNVADIRTESFIGPYGSTEHGQVEKTSNAVIFRSGKTLPAGTGLTIVAGLPVGSVRRPTLAQELWWFVRDWWPLVGFPLIAGLVVYSAWHRRGRDEGAGTQAVGVEFEPPRELSPSEVGTLIDESCDLPDIIATLVDLAARGWITIKEMPAERILFLSSRDYQFIRNAPPPHDKLKPHEERFLDGLFDEDSDTTRLSDQKNKFYSNIAPIKRAISDSMMRMGLFKHDPSTVRTLWRVAGGAMIGLGVILTMFLASIGYVAYGLGLIISGLIVFFAANAMPARTMLGTRKLIECLSFRRFVEKVEKDRIKTMAMTDPTVFGRLLPYAMVLGVADQWAEAFADLMIAAPTWYQSHENRPFNTRYFIGNLGSGMRTMQKTFTSQPQPKGGAGSGSSGFGGGGFSGGGFGGGGGGSW